MELSKISARGQTTIPKSIRDRTGLREGDRVAFDVEGDSIILKKLVTGQDDYLRGLSESMNEWESEPDEEAFRDL